MMLAVGMHWCSQCSTLLKCTDRMLKILILKLLCCTKIPDGWGLGMRLSEQWLPKGKSKNYYNTHAHAKLHH